MARILEENRRKVGAGCWAPGGSVYPVIGEASVRTGVARTAHKTSRSTARLWMARHAAPRLKSRSAGLLCRWRRRSARQPRLQRRSRGRRGRRQHGASRWGAGCWCCSCVCPTGLFACMPLDCTHALLNRFYSLFRGRRASSLSTTEGGSERAGGAAWRHGPLRCTPSHAPTCSSKGCKPIIVCDFVQREGFVLCLLPTARRECPPTRCVCWACAAPPPRSSMPRSSSPPVCASVSRPPSPLPS